MKVLFKKRKQIAVFFIAVFTCQLLGSTAAYALTSGPSQPEMQSFAPAGASNMVDLFSGDFSYNIPLFELPGPNGGYPFNLSYQSGITMDQEASWVGLGFSLNPGAITRQMRGLPDEFNGDKVSTTMTIKPNITTGLGAGVGVEFFGGDLALGLGFSVYQNTFKGFGYSVDGSVGFSKTSSATGMTRGIGLDFSVDSQSGVNLSPSLTLGNKIGNVGIGAGFNSREGLQDVTTSANVKTKVKDKKGNSHQFKSKSSSSLSLVHPGYTPQISMPMMNTNLSVTIKAQATWWGVAPGAHLNGFYNSQKLVNDGKAVEAGAYGYMNYQNASDAKALLDFNREKDGMVMDESPNLAIPSLTYDIFSVTGQGISAMYRPMRNDFNVMRDPETISTSWGGSAGVDVGPAASRVGVHIGLNHSASRSGSWTEGGGDFENSFSSKNINDAFEPWYFKVHGDYSATMLNTSDALSDSDPVSINIQKKNTSNDHVIATKTLKGRNGDKTIPTVDASRKSRSQDVQMITNDQLLDASNSEMLPQFKIKYLNTPVTTSIVNGQYVITKNEMQLSRRTSYLPSAPQSIEQSLGHHMTAMTALNADGLRYNYGIPAYNMVHEEVQFSLYQPTSTNGTSVTGLTDGTISGAPNVDSHTDQFIKKTELPPYAHSFLLTSILGPDYVDVTNNGVTDDDLGYWVKFTYLRTTENGLYKWREPYNAGEGHWMKGWLSDSRDDKGSYTYGEKELWYLQTAETKSHIAVFSTSDRTDGFGSTGRLQSGLSQAKAVKKLDKVQLFIKNGSTPTLLQAVNFGYAANGLCSGAPNGTSGKLTLQEIWFTYGNSATQLNPYRFTYQSGPQNPAYNQLRFDRWGTYRPALAGDPYSNIDFPYSDQVDVDLADGATNDTKTTIDANASAWSLKQIQLPSGGIIIIDYESDDYAYVQHKQAMQMTEMVQPVDTAPSSGDFQVSNGRIRFKLPRSINASDVTDDGTAAVKEFLDMTRGQVYFKAKVHLHLPGDNTEEFISGYAKIDPGLGKMFLDDGNGLTSKGSTHPSNYYYGNFYLAADESGVSAYDPIALRAWQHMRTNQPELAFHDPHKGAINIKNTNDIKEKVLLIKSLEQIGKDIKAFFNGYYGKCENKGWGKTIVKGKAWVRLKCTDFIKLGGGSRVKQITIKDQWSESNQPGDATEGIYGEYYDYTMEENDKLISSGVASYEPFTGGDENPLRYAKTFSQSIPLRSDNNLFFEYPINESYYPGPQVGYRKVTVMSLAAANLASRNNKVAAIDPNVLHMGYVRLRNVSSLFPIVNSKPAEIGTTGKTVHEFYTAREFPVITEETDKKDLAFRLSVPVPLLGHISVSKLASSQGYSIITNDMHGKQKKVSTYRQRPDGTFEDTDPISWTQYNYIKAERVYENEKVSWLNARFKDNGDNTLSKPVGNETGTHSLAEEVEFFMDMRQFEDKAWSGGARVNTDIIYVPFIVPITIPIPTDWPNIGKTENLLKTAVTNKVIFRSGILESVEAYDGGSRLITNNLKWDKLTGTVVLASVNNNFDDPIYNYSIPAYSQYQGMGAAYKNSGLTFDIINVAADPNNLNYYQFSPALEIGDMLFPGDEILLYEEGTDLTRPVARAVYSGNSGGDDYLHVVSGQTLTYAQYDCMIVRSGYRNQLSVMAGSISALVDPSTTTANLKTYAKDIDFVK
jgi:hypothetical protein